METILLVLTLIWTVGGTILINKSTESGGLDWIKAHLRISWMAFLSFTTVLILCQPLIWRTVVSTHEQWNNKPLFYALCFVVGGLIFCCYFWFADKISPGIKKEAEKTAKEGTSPAIKKHLQHINLLELFKQDFSNSLRVSNEFTLNIGGGATAKIYANEYFNFEGRTKFLSFYVPMSTQSYEICESLTYGYIEIMKKLEENAAAIGGYVGDSAQTSSQELIFSNRIYIYHENTFTLQQLASLERVYTSKGLSVIFRSTSYMMSRQPKN